MLNSLKRQAFEKVFVTRAFNLCEALITNAKIESDVNKKTETLLFSIDLLRLLKRMMLDVGKSREIK